METETTSTTESDESRTEKRQHQEEYMNPMQRESQVYANNVDREGMNKMYRELESKQKSIHTRKSGCSAN